MLLSMFCETVDGPVSQRSQRSPETLTISVVSEHHALTHIHLVLNRWGLFLSFLTWVKRQL